MDVQLRDYVSVSDISHQCSVTISEINSIMEVKPVLLVVYYPQCSVITTDPAPADYQVPRAASRCWAPNCITREKENEGVVV